VIGWFDGGAGASGDMFLGALVGVGVPIEAIADSIDRLGLGITLRAEPVQRGGIGAIKVHVDVPTTRTIRRLPEIVALFDQLDSDIRTFATRVFERLAEAEANVHQVAIDDVHFHEVGALDSIADVVGAATGLAHLRLDRISCSTLSLGSGVGRGAHGPLPVPVPAVLQLVAGDIPVQAGRAPFESTTPTGAALMVTIVDEWSAMPPMTISGIGMGAGSNDSEHVANVLRLVIGEPVGRHGAPTGG